MEERVFKPGDWVVYKPFENCKPTDVSGRGKVMEVLPLGMYVVTFGFLSIHGTRTGKYCWSNLWPSE